MRTTGHKRQYAEDEHHRGGVWELRRCVQLRGRFRVTRLRDPGLIATGEPAPAGMCNDCGGLCAGWRFVCNEVVPRDGHFQSPMSRYLAYPDVVFRDRQLLLASLAELGFVDVEEGDD